ncbi:AbiJ-NTD4 domain-containing protein [Pannus brasiliensis]
MPVKSFSQRRGLKPVVIQLEGMNQNLKNSLWNLLSENVFLKNSTNKSIAIYIKMLWKDFFKYRLDDLLIDFGFIHKFAIFDRLDRNTIDEIQQQIQQQYDYLKWHEIYDFFEFTLNYFESIKLVEAVNRVLERELSGYRFIEGVFTEITDEREIEILQEEISDTNFPAVSRHLQRALELMSDRKNPDYRNSIKESISAVESLAKEITQKPKATLSQALNVLESSKNLHPALKESFLKLYAYTSDEGGIRHAMLTEPDLTLADARFFLLSCTSFINYLKSKL